MTDKTNLDPKTSPDTLKKGGFGVRRVNNVPLYIILGVLIVFILVLIMAGSKKSHLAEEISPQASHSATGGALNILDGKQQYGTIAAAPPPAPPEIPSMPGPSSTPSVPSTKVTQADTNTPPLPPRLVSAPNETTMAPPEDENLLRAEQSMNEAKLSQFQEGLKSHSTVSISMARSPASARQRVAAGSLSNGQESVADLKEKISHDQGDHTGRGDNYGDFDAKQSDRWSLNNKEENPQTYMLRTGAVIPATLISGINSELPGQINAQISQNVYDTATGRYLLIPQGSRLVGAYNNQIAYGQSRILIAWQRIVFPDGKALDIGAMPGAGLDGYAGLKDQVNHHFLRLFGSALLMSGISAGINYTQNQQQGNNYGYNQNSSSTLSQSLGQGLGQAMIQMFEKNLNIAPTLQVRPGFVLNVMVSKDLRFSKPYHEFDY